MPLIPKDGVYACASPTCGVMLFDISINGKYSFYDPLLKRQWVETECHVCQYPAVYSLGKLVIKPLEGDEVFLGIEKSVPWLWAPFWEMKLKDGE